MILVLVIMKVKRREEIDCVVYEYDLVVSFLSDIYGRNGIGYLFVF